MRIERYRVYSVVFNGRTIAVQRPINPYTDEDPRQRLHELEFIKRELADYIAKQIEPMVMECAVPIEFDEELRNPTNNITITASNKS